MVHRSTISGSRAALWMIVTPSASTAAIRMFSVAPTDGKSSWISRAAQLVGLGDHAAVLDVAARAQLAQARLVHVQRAGSDRVTAGQRHLGPLAAATSGPSTQTDARNCRHRGEIGVVLRLVGGGDPHDVDRRGRQSQPRPRRTSRHQRNIQDVRAVGDGAWCPRPAAPRPSASARCSWRRRRQLRPTTGCRRSPRTARSRRSV